MNFPKNTTENRSKAQFEVFFDGDCPLCKREIEMIRRHNKRGELLLTDIASPDFQSADRSLESLMKEIHGRYPDGRYVTGVEVFREIYQRIGLGPLVKTTRWPVIRQTLDLVYRVFARVRFYFAMRRIRKRNPTCKLSDGKPACHANVLPPELESRP